MVRLRSSMTTLLKAKPSLRSRLLKLAKATRKRTFARAAGKTSSVCFPTAQASWFVSDQPEERSVWSPGLEEIVKRLYQSSPEATSPRRSQFSPPSVEYCNTAPSDASVSVQCLRDITGREKSERSKQGLFT